MPAATITVPYEELEGSPKEKMGRDGFEAQRVLICDWTNRISLASQFQGGNFSGTFYAPQKYTAFPAARVFGVGMEPFDDNRPMPLGVGSGTQTATYTKAKLTVDFKTGLDSGGSEEDPDGKIVQESVEPFAEFLTLPADGYVWDAPDGEPLTTEEAPGKMFKGFVWCYERSGFLTIPAAVYDLIGKVNSASVHSRSLNYDFDAETLLYEPPMLHRQVSGDGTSAWTLAYRFKFKPQGWNRFWRQSESTWSRIYTAAGPADPYEVGDFTDLL